MKGEAAFIGSLIYAVLMFLILTTGTTTETQEPTSTQPSSQSQMPLEASPSEQSETLESVTVSPSPLREESSPKLPAKRGGDNETGVEPSKPPKFGDNKTGAGPWEGMGKTENKTRIFFNISGVEETPPVDVEIYNPLTGERLIGRGVDIGKVTQPRAEELHIKITDTKTGLSVVLPVDATSDLSVKAIIQEENKSIAMPPRGIEPVLIQTIDLKIELVANATILFNYSMVGLGAIEAVDLTAFKCPDYSGGSCPVGWTELQRAPDFIDVRGKTVKFIVGKEFSTFLLGLHVKQSEKVRPYLSYGEIVRDKEEGQGFWYALIFMISFSALFLYYFTVHQKKAL